MQDTGADTTYTIDTMSPLAALRAMAESHSLAAQSVLCALPQIQAAAAAIAAAISSGSTLHYIAAGSSGLMALADACELPGTFRIPQEQIRIHMAGGVPADGRMPGDTEDDEAAARRIAEAIKAGDIAIVVSASGTTPYACAAARAANELGHKVVGLANVSGSLLLDLSDIAIALPTAPEVLQGSTRLGAGTAQKTALNMISTLAGVFLGHVHDGMMVNLKPDNQKLRQRAADIVRNVARVDGDAAQRALVVAGYDTKLAILIATGAEPDEARTILAENNHNVRDSLNAAKPS